jgi:hypothetical protein
MNTHPHRTPADAPIEAFFDEFAAASDAGDWDRYGDMFLTQFMNADPATATVIARDDLIAFLPHRKGVFERAGATGTALASLATTHLDDRHVLAETTWSITYEPGRAPEEVPVLHATFVLRLEDRWRVALYLNHNNLLELLGLD